MVQCAIVLEFDLLQSKGVYIGKMVSKNVFGSPKNSSLPEV